MILDINIMEMKRLYIYIYISCHAASTDIPDPLSLLFPIDSSPQAGLQGYIPYPPIAAICIS